MAKFNLFAAIDIGSSRLELKIFQLTKEGGVSVIENCESKLSQEEKSVMTAPLVVDTGVLSREIKFSGLQLSLRSIVRVAQVEK